jgi:Adenosine deaminase z-alpha domain
MDEIDQLKEQINQLTARLSELEERVIKLESGSVRPSANPSNSSSATATAPKEGLLEVISTALQQIGEGDAAAIRQAIAKNMPDITRSDINKVLYANKDLFEVARQEGMKPIWRVATQ